MSAQLTAHGMQIQDDWMLPLEHGRVSWMFAFENQPPFWPSRTDTQGRKYRRVLHQVKDPITSITSMCTEIRKFHPHLYPFLSKKLNMSIAYTGQASMRSGRVALQFWVGWHSFLKDVKFPTYQIETIDAKSIFQMAGLEAIYNATPSKLVSRTHNTRGHRKSFTWQELYTIDPELTAQAWDLAHYYNYSYPGVNFDNLTCLESFTDCANAKHVPTLCPPGTHPFPKDGMTFELSQKPATGGPTGWVDAGCIEHKMDDGRIVGIPGTSLIPGVAEIMDAMLPAGITTMRESLTLPGIELKLLLAASLVAVATICRISPRRQRTWKGTGATKL